jgi:hypothetical protein
MASVVDICNLALSHLGDTATVASIDPPEGSAQAEHCARFYPIARDTLLELHPWGFATRRALLAPLSETMDQWDYVYAVPNLAIKILAVLPSEAADDYVLNATSYSDDAGEVSAAYGAYSPQPFVVETLASGAKVILTNQEEALARFTVTVTDSAKFSPLFTMALSWLLASLLAGSLIKQEAGAAEAKRCLQFMQALLGQAAMSDANQRVIRPTPIVPWMAGR